MEGTARECKNSYSYLEYICVYVCACMHAHMHDEQNGITLLVVHYWQSNIYSIPINEENNLRDMGGWYLLHINQPRN